MIRIKPTRVGLRRVLCQTSMPKFLPKTCAGSSHKTTFTKLHFSIYKEQWPIRTNWRNSATVKFTKCAHMVQMFAERSAKTFARKWRLFTSVSMTAGRYTTPLVVVSKRSLGEPSRVTAPSRAWRRQKATPLCIMSITVARRRHQASPQSRTAPMHRLQFLLTYELRPTTMYTYIISKRLFTVTAGCFIKHRHRPMLFIFWTNQFQVQVLSKTTDFLARLQELRYTNFSVP